jgi:DNA invertase Pin-like site-specific DNA recombinase
MSALLVGYARCSTDQQDLTAQRDGLLALNVAADRIYVDHGLPAPTENAPDSARPWPPAAPGTPSS